MRREDALFWDRPRVVYHRVYFSIRREIRQKSGVGHAPCPDVRAEDVICFRVVFAVGRSTTRVTESVCERVRARVSASESESESESERLSEKCVSHVEPKGDGFGFPGSRCCIPIYSAMVGVPHRPLLPSLPTMAGPGASRTAFLKQELQHKLTVHLRLNGFNNETY